jgi:hypothetical protein
VNNGSLENRSNLMQVVKIRIKGYIDRDWSDWIKRLTVVHTLKGETVLAGTIRDQAALYGLLSKLADLGLQINSISSRISKPTEEVTNKAKIA